MYARPLSLSLSSSSSSHSLSLSLFTGVGPRSLSLCLSLSLPLYEYIYMYIYIYMCAVMCTSTMCRGFRKIVLLIRKIQVAQEQKGWWPRISGSCRTWSINSTRMGRLCNNFGSILGEAPSWGDGRKSASSLRTWGPHKIASRLELYTL